MNVADAFARPEGNPLPESGRTSHASLTLLREWQSVCDAVAHGQNHLLIRKGGIAEGRDGFQVRKNFFGLLPTLFHQVKSHAPHANAPEPPRTVDLLCQLVDAWSVPSTTDLSSVASFHRYEHDQLSARQNYKTDRPLSLILVRAFRLRQPLEIAAGEVKAACRSWIDLPLSVGLGGIEAIADPALLEPILSHARQAIEALPNVQPIHV